MSNSTDDRLYYLALSHFNKIGAATFSRLEKYFPDMRSAFQASYHNLTEAGLSAKLSEEFITWRKSFRPEQALETLKKEKINFVVWNEDLYPRYLKEISDPPPVLYFKGILRGSDIDRLAVVGSRKHSTYGEKTIQLLIPALAQNGIEIVSGLAIGLDSLAHRATLEAGGKTIAVLGSGLKNNNIYPRINCRLAEEIIETGGALVSEFSPQTPAYKQNFPRRNRLIAGLSQATLVIEAGQKSGSLITARCALEENRDVLAVPGNIFSEFSIGTNWLIKSGAKTVTDLGDILEIFKIESDIRSPLEKTTRTLQKTGKTTEEKIIYTILKEAFERSERITADEISQKSQLDIAIINSTLGMLEIEGLAENDGYSYYLK